MTNAIENARSLLMRDISDEAIKKLARMIAQGGEIERINIRVKARMFDGSIKLAVIDHHGFVSWIRD